MQSRPGTPVQHRPRGEFVRFDADELAIIEAALRHLSACTEHVEHDQAVRAALCAGRVHVLNETLGGIGLHARPLDAVLAQLATS